MRKSSIVAFITILLALFLCGCGEKEAPEVNQTEYVDFTQVVTAKEADAKNIYVITKVHNSSYWQKLCQGAQQAGEDFGCNIYLGGTLNELDLDGQTKLLEEVWQQGADALLLAPINSNVEYPLLKEMKDAGIPIILVDTIRNSNDFDVCFMTDNMQAGRILAEDMLKKLREAGNSEEEVLQVGIQVGSLTSQTIVERVAGFSEYWSDYAPEKWTILEQIYCNDGEVSRAKEMAEEMLRTYENLRGVVGCNNGSTVGLAMELKESGRKDIVLVGFDFSKEIVELIHDDSYKTSTVVQQQYEMGYQGVEAACKLLDGGVIGYKFADTQVELVDSQNVEQYEASQ